MIVVPVERRIDWKRPPIVLIALVLINVLVFTFYQTDDFELYEEAMQIYQSNQLLEIELPAYRAYLRKISPDEKLNRNDPLLSQYIVFDSNFAKFIDKHQRRYIPSSKKSVWQRGRTELEAITAKISSNALGLNPFDIGPLTIFTHLFLHGDFSHLLGNMVFLILTGFAVEAALGSRKFLAYYLISGVGAGLLFAGLQAASGQPTGNLVGASGAISGVMAMYVVLFGMRKIDFFYWVFVFTGYFRAAAVIMLPAYILKEIFFLVFTEGSNVAYTAHIGGFIVGAVLVYVTQQLLETSIDDKYLDGEVQSADPYLEKLQALYTQIGQSEFKRSWELLTALKKEGRKRPELIEIEYNLLVALNSVRADEFLLKRLGQPNPPRVSLAQAEKWLRMNSKEQDALVFEQKSAFAQSLLKNGKVNAAEKIYQQLKADPDHQPELAALARNIAAYYEHLGEGTKSQRYTEQARAFMGVASLSPVGGDQ